MKAKNGEVQQAKKTKHLVRGILCLLAILLMSLPPASAQEPGANQQILEAVGQQIGQSMQALTGYSYQQRTEVQVNGETKIVQLAQVAFGPDKQPFITPISSQPPEDTGRGLRGRIKREKAEEMKEEVQQLVQFSNRYLMLKGEQIQQLIQQGQAWVNPGTGTVKVDVSNFFQPGDHMTINCDGMTKNRMQTQVQASSNGTPVTINALFQTLPTGLNYLAQTTINVPSKGLQITINTLNYIKQ